VISDHLPKGNAAYINRLNKVKVLDLIRKTGAISRAEIVKDTGLSAPTVTRVVDSLINDEQLVMEVGIGDSTGGRPPILVQFNGEQQFVIGIDLGTTYTRGVLSDLDARILAEIQIPTDVESGFDSVMEGVRHVSAQLIESEETRKGRIRGMGMAVAGLINRKKKIVEFSPDFDWLDAAVHDVLEKHFGFPLIFDNVTRVMALGELWYGIGSKYRNFICVNVGYGIGSGIVVNGKPFFGADGMAGEFGHITLEKDSDIRCKCGNYGCLEALASGRGIALAAQRELESGRSSKLVEMCKRDFSTVTAEMVVKAAKDGDELARDVFTKAAQYIGIGIASLINLFNPQAVVIGGGVSQAGDALFEIIRATVNKRVIPRHRDAVYILPVTHGANAAVMGAVSLVLHEVLNLSLSAK